MGLALYQNNGAPRVLPLTANLGLWYDKFVNTWDEQKFEYDKRSWIKTVVGSRPNALLEEACARLYDLAGKLDGEIRCFQTEGRFVTGLGREHPVENGFAWHHSLGSPYLPGSSVKGMARAWAKQWQKVAGEEINRIFGDEEKKIRGSIIFFDALPTNAPTLEEEVMTPHYAEYYRGDGPPADWYSPVPIPFLTVAAGQKFLFAVAPVNQKAKADAIKAMKWLGEALEWIGAGAKTAVGYGRFKIDIIATNELQKKAREAEQEAITAGFTPIRQRMEDQGYSKGEAFMSVWPSEWLPKLTSTQTSEDEKREIAELLAQWYQKVRPGVWEKPEGKNQVKVEAIKKALGQ